MRHPTSLNRIPTLPHPPEAFRTQAEQVAHLLGPHLEPSHPPPANYDEAGPPHANVSDPGHAGDTRHPPPPPSAVEIAGSIASKFAAAEAAAVAAASADDPDHHHHHHHRHSKSSSAHPFPNHGGDPMHEAAALFGGSSLHPTTHDQPQSAHRRRGPPTLRTVAIVVLAALRLRKCGAASECLGVPSGHGSLLSFLPLPPVGDDGAGGGGKQSPKKGRSKKERRSDRIVNLPPPAELLKGHAHTWFAVLLERVTATSVTSANGSPSRRAAGQGAADGAHNAFVHGGYAHNAHSQGASLNSDSGLLAVLGSGGKRRRRRKGPGGHGNGARGGGGNRSGHGHYAAGLWSDVDDGDDDVDPVVMLRRALLSLAQQVRATLVCRCAAVLLCV